MLLIPEPVVAKPDAILPLLTGERRAGLGWARLAIWLAWLAVAGWLAAGHVLWRDEVRAFTLALSGGNVFEMLWNIHGEGHPALWYLLLRGAHALTGVREVLPGLAFAIGAAATALFAWRAPFRPLVVALVLFGAFALHEYAVVARNYGITMLLLFAFAWGYPRWRDRGGGLGLLLALLCNTNVPSVMLAGALGLFWGAEIWSGEGLRWTPAWRHYLVNMALALVGVIACLAEVYPPYNDAAVSPLAGSFDLATVVMAAFNLTASFSGLLPQAWLGVPVVALLLAAMVVGPPLGLIRSPGGLAATLPVMIGMPLFFQIVYPGEYRHQALYVVFLLTVYWLVANGHGGRWPKGAPVLREGIRATLQRFGQGALLALLVAQVAISVWVVGGAARGDVYSRSRDLAALLERDRLKRAVLVANPDVLLEPMPYYLANPTWMMREQRWARIAAFTKSSVRAFCLGDVLHTAQALRARTHRPVVILMQLPLDPAAPSQTWPQGYLGTLSTTPAEVRAFLGATQRLARFAPAVTDESYDVYLLR